MPRELVLANGLRVLVVERPGTGLVAVDLRYRAGSRHEPRGRTGLAHLTEHLMFAPGHMTELEGLGAVYDADTWFEHTAYHTLVRPQHLERVLRLEAARMRESPRRLGAQREVVRAEVLQRVFAFPYGTHLPHLLPLCHPFGHTPAGIEEDLDAITLRDCVAFHRNWYVPGNAVLAVVGDVPTATAIELAALAFTPVPPGRTELIAPELPGRYVTGEAPPRLTVPEPQPLPAVYQAFRLPPEGGAEIEAADLALRVLAAGEGSRLHRRLAEEGAQSVEVDVHRFAVASSLAIVKVHAAPGSDLAAMERAVTDEIAELAAGGFRPGELARAKAMATRAALERVETVGGLAAELTLEAVQTGEAGRALTAARRIAAVTEPAALAAVWRLGAPAGVLTYLPKES
ncbi:M16 family metallopeptidase [Nonomuraea sp. NPDC050328]|uniref:M16 family metallopeptidase n=1 Tax=Nonomuraea sp. NPDC050328 TaxID=3364361 RepID=UPI0037B28D1B